MKSKSIVAVALAICALLAVQINLAFAGTAISASVWAEDSAKQVRNQFYIGETMYIYWNEEPPGSTIDVNVTDSGGNVLVSWPNQPESANGTLSYTFTAPGYYFIKCGGAQPFPIAVATIFVVPEAVLGSLSLVAVGLVAYGIVKMKRLKK